MQAFLSRIPLVFIPILIGLCVLTSATAQSVGTDGMLVVAPARSAQEDPASASCSDRPSAARAWNEQLLFAIRHASSRPTVHARNLFHLSAAMYDAWAAYVPDAAGLYLQESVPADGDTDTAQAEAVSYAAYRLLFHRFASSVAADEALASFETCMLDLGFDPSITTTAGSSPAALGNRVAATVIDHGLADGANEAGSYVDYIGYFPVNNPMLVQLPGTGGMTDVNAWQPLVPPGSFGVQNFLTPFWGRVTPFAIERPAAGALYLDPGPPPQLGGAGDAELKSTVLEIIRFSAGLDPDDGVVIDISPSHLGNNSLGTNDGAGHAVNPATGEPYPPNPVLRGDWTRVISEFWADGPESTTPPGHWNEVANSVADHPDFEARIGATGPERPRLEWDVKMYLALNGALHDTAIATWEAKHHYDSSRPISLVREMADAGQSTDPGLPAWHPEGLALEAGLVELITPDSSAPGQRHEHLADHVGDVAVKSWRGHPADPESDYGGVGWILGVEWLPYQQIDFVTPPFAGYTSGHSGFSRAAAEVLTELTGSPWFPGGMGGYTVSADSGDFSLEFEHGPSAPVQLQWATYYDAADEAGLSRIWGGIHPSFDDLPGRIIGAEAGLKALERAFELFGAPAGSPSPVPVPVPANRPAGLLLIALLLLMTAVIHMRTSRRPPGAGRIR